MKHHDVPLSIRTRREPRRIIPLHDDLIGIVENIGEPIRKGSGGVHVSNQSHQAGSAGQARVYMTKE